MGSFERFKTKTHFNSLKRLVGVTALAALAVKLLTVALATAAGGGTPLDLLARVPASVADLGAALLVFEVLRTRRPLQLAARSAILVAVSPVLFVASGLHGDRVGVAVALLLLAMYLLVDRDAPLVAGITLAIASRVEPMALLAAPVALAAARRRPGARRRRAGAPGWSISAGPWSAPCSPPGCRPWPGTGTRWPPPPAAGPGRAASGPAGCWPGRSTRGWPGGWPGPAAPWCWPRPCCRRWSGSGGGRAGSTPPSAWSCSPPSPSPPPGRRRDLVWPAVFGYLGDARWASIYAVAAGATMLWTSTWWGTGVPWHGGVDPATVPSGAVAGLGLVTWVVLGSWLVLGWRTVAVEASDRAAGRAARGPRAPGPRYRRERLRPGPPANGPPRRRH